MITEPDVALTDYGLALECALFAYLLVRRRDGQRPLQTWFALFFGSLSAAALAGGTLHGFFLDPQTTGQTILWPATLLAIGVTALSAWVIGVLIQFPEAVARWIVILAIVAFAGYCAIVLLVTQTFWVAVVNYLPAAGFLFLVFSLTYQRTRERPVLVGAAGLALTFVAAGARERDIALHPVYFNHNALYHLIQAVALFMVFWAARWFVMDRAR